MDIKLKIFIGIIFTLFMTYASIHMSCFMKGMSLFQILSIWGLFAIISFPTNIVIFILCLFIPESIFSQQDVINLYNHIPCGFGSTSWQAIVLLSWFSIVGGVFINGLIATYIFARPSIKIKNNENAY